MSQIDRSLAQAARAWPFEEARKLLARTGGKAPAKGYVLLETGYGPSGLPHIGTFGEVVRTTMVRQAFRRLSDVPARLFCFSDDMDGLRKVPDNVPNKEMLAAHLGKPLTAVPDPFSNEYPSFGAANNARLRAFLDSFGFEYEFQSATDWYKSGRFDKMLLAMLQHYDEVQAVMPPTLDEEGKKISKSKGNGLSVEEWLRYAPPESLALYMQQQPRRAKRLYFDVIPRAVDEYLAAIEKLPAEEPAKALENAAWHNHDGAAPANSAAGVNFGMLLNLASVAHTENKDVLWQYLRRYVPGATPETAPYLDRLLSGAVAYYQDFVKASKKFRLPTAKERDALKDLADTLRKLPEEESAEFIQNEVYEVGKRHFAQAELRQWFKALYEVLLGSEQGPRMGAFIKLYGRDNVVRLIERALAGEDLGKAA